MLAEATRFAQPISKKKAPFFYLPGYRLCGYLAARCACRDCEWTLNEFSRQVAASRDLAGLEEAKDSISKWYKTPEHSVDMAFIIDGTKNPVTLAGDAFFPASNYEMWESATYTAAARPCSSRPNGSGHCLTPKAKSITLLGALTLFTKLSKICQI